MQISPAVHVEIACRVVWQWDGPAWQSHLHQIRFWVLTATHSLQTLGCSGRGSVTY